MRTATVVSPGPLSTIQDHGRPGLAHLGIGRSGAADRPALALANSLVGNNSDDAAIEMTLGRLRIRFEVDVVIAITGAHCRAAVDGRELPMEAAVGLRAGQELRFGSPSSGLRTYLAVGGGIIVPAVLGSRSTDTLSGIGPEKLSAGTILPLGPTPSHPSVPTVAPDPTRSPEATAAALTPVLSILPGPRVDWFVPGTLEILCATTWHVTTEVNRIGARLAGPTLVRRITAELPPEPMVVGALQIPADGQPILFLADHPVTGGYPVLAVVGSCDLPVAAQLRPGGPVRFRLL